MKKELKKKDKEPLSVWCERIAEALAMTEEQSKAMKEVSKWSYIYGVHDGEAAMYDYQTKEEHK